MRRACVSVTLLLSFVLSAAQVFAFQAQEPVDGIDTIPPSAVVMSKEQMQETFVPVDLHDELIIDIHGIKSVRDHSETIREVACWAHVTLCKDYNNPLTVPFTFLGDNDPPLPYKGIFDYSVLAWLMREIRRIGDVKIITRSVSCCMGDSTSPVEFYGASLPFLAIESTGNDAEDSFFPRGCHQLASAPGRHSGLVSVYFLGQHERGGSA